MSTITITTRTTSDQVLGLAADLATLNRWLNNKVAADVIRWAINPELNAGVVDAGQLTEVRGIGPKTAEKIRQHVLANGQPMGKADTNNQGQTSPKGGAVKKTKTAEPTDGQKIVAWMRTRGFFLVDGKPIRAGEEIAQWMETNIRAVTRKGAFVTVHLTEDADKTRAKWVLTRMAHHVKWARLMYGSSGLWGLTIKAPK